MPDLLSNKDHLVVYLSAHGKSTPEIAEAMGLSPASVKTLLAKEHIQFEIKQLHHKLFGRDVQKRFKEMLAPAQDALEQILVNPNQNTKPGLKFSAAQEVFDRALGKPKQSIEHSGSLVADLIDRLNGDKPTIDITPKIVKQVALDNPNHITERVVDNPNLDPIDQWAKDNV